MLYKYKYPALNIIVDDDSGVMMMVLLFQRCIVMRQFYLSYKQVKHDYSLPRAYAVICGRFNITVNRDYLHDQNQGKLATVCLQQFSSIFESTIMMMIALLMMMSYPGFCLNLCT